ncbi:MAG: hypothetical protein KF857_09420 [Fimbriimonadaceae bacterium]|nr:hypothetical protein [Fimbriimonadaceae bacterium]
MPRPAEGKQPWTDDKATEILRRFYEVPFGANVVTIQRRRSPVNRSTFLAHVESSMGVGAKITILEPISVQGMQYIDNGDVLRSYLPDLNTVYTQPSPQRLRMGQEERMAAIKANYRVRLLDPTEVARRRADVVELRPRNPRMPVRRMTIDAKEAFLLRSEVIDEDTVKWVDTIKVTFYSDRLPPFSFHEPRDVVRRESFVKIVKDGKFAMALLGFEPRLPKRLPFGLKVVAQQVSGSESNPVFSVVLSDGVATVTVSQWNTRKSKEDGNERPMAVDAYGIGFTAYGDTPDDVLQEVARTFGDQFSGQ